MIKSYDWVTLQQKQKAYGDNFVKKVVTDVDVSVEGANEVVAVVSTDAIDRSGEIVLPKGVDLTDFRKQPAVYLEHDTDALPLGPCLWIKATDKAIIAKYRIVPEASELHRAVWELVKAGAYRSHSIGFLSHISDAPTTRELKAHPEWEGAKRIHRKSSLLEFSLVGLPCNTDAVALAVSKGFSDETISFLKGDKGTDDEAMETVKEEVREVSEADVQAAFYKALYQRLSRQGK